jgi:hypothetical protein
MELCPKCSFEISDSYKYCPGCGDLLVLQKKCAECLRQFGINFKFCTDCGIGLVLAIISPNAKDTSQQQPPPAPTPPAIKETQPVLLPPASVTPPPVIVDNTTDKGKKVKVGILRHVGGVIEPIKHPDGGGNRYCYICESDATEDVLTKICMLYFPGKFFFFINCLKKFNYF